ncbi:hypothetical protein [Streptomyces sp. NPDC051997]|uniref:hypothetical protein n=1 Tax=Streptomyces sp. NPDC051997 TaxID=3155611 RepID=UPI003414A7BB
MSLRRKYADLHARHQALVAATQAEHAANTTEEFVLARIAGQLDTVKTVVAQHLAGASHPATAVQDVAAFAESLRQSLAAAGIDLRLELARLEGADL